MSINHNFTPNHHNHIHNQHNTIYNSNIKDSHCNGQPQSYRSRHLATPNAFRPSTSPRPATPPRRRPSMPRDASVASYRQSATDRDAEPVGEDDPIHIMLKEQWSRAESSISALFSQDAASSSANTQNPSYPALSSQQHAGSPRHKALGQEADRVELDAAPDRQAPVRRPVRTLVEDYGEEDDDEEEEDKAHSPSVSQQMLGKDRSQQSERAVSLKPATVRASTSSSSDHGKSSEDVRKKLEEDKKAAEDAARRSFHTMFYTLESDRDAMLEQQKLDELDRQVENEMSNAPGPTSAPGTNGAHVQGSLSNADLGASSLTLKNLIARIDAKRSMVNANDTQLRTLISEVRKGRSKWASEDKVGQEELYEAADKVLMELKAMTEYSTPFLQRVNKRDAPDYFHIIKQPMDIGTMIKKLKSLAYKSKKEFVDDLKLIWANCLAYNADPNHPLRKKALYMRKETDKLVPLIPEIVVRDRAEVELEERRMQNDVDLEGGEDSDDDQPIMASRGRKAPSKGKKGPTNQARKAGPKDTEETPAPEAKPAFHASTTSLRNDFLRADSDAPIEGSSNGFSTPPPPGSRTPLGTNGLSQPDLTEIDGVSGQTIHHEDSDEDDAEFKTWKQVTKKDRAMAAADRNRLFRGDHLNAEEPALLRNKAGMRRWLRQQKQYLSEESGVQSGSYADRAEPDATSTGETLAEGIEKDQDRTLPDYYDVLTAIPDLNNQFKWVEDSEGKVVPQTEQYLRVFPKDQFKFSESTLTRRMEANMRQMQDTRKVCAKIGVVKQMQIQTQTYQNQFQKYDPEPFVEQDIGAVAVSEDGPIMSPWVCRAAFQRSVGKMFYHAGFEDFQPSALEAATDIASDFFTKLIRTFTSYREQPRLEVSAQRFTTEEQVLHSLNKNGLDLDALETYVKDDVERLSGKLSIVHDRMKAHLADLLRPALGDHAGQDGAGAFNDGSEQFVGGDFAEDIDEDFFGFKELGLAAEFGLESLSVPLHLLQNRINKLHPTLDPTSVSSSGIVFPPPATYEPVTTENLASQISLVQDFFATKLAANQGRPLIEDEDLPQKQRFPKPRLPPTGKISSPRKRPLREQQQIAKKKRKLEENKDDHHKTSMKPIGPLKLTMPDSRNREMDPEKENGVMVSPPESVTAN